MTQILLGAVGALLLFVFFRAVEARWPESYYGLSDLTSYQLSLRLGSYLSFRFLPVVAVAFLAGAVAMSLGESSTIAGLMVGFIHSAATAGRASLNAIRAKRIFRPTLVVGCPLGSLFPGAHRGMGWRTSGWP